MPLHHLLPDIKGVPVLMYHRVWPGMSDGLTLTPEQLREQWQYLKENGYRNLALQEFIDYTKNGHYPDQSFLLTFDDGYYNNLTYVYPLLKEFGWTATIFISADLADGTAEKDTDEVSRKMNLAELKQLDPAIIQLGMHGYHHEHFGEQECNDIEKIMKRSLRAFEQSGLEYHKVLAYPYGGRPKTIKNRTAMKRSFARMGIDAAFRIGNKPNKMPLKDIYEIKRIDIRGEDSLKDFTIKLRKGKLKPF